MAKLGKPLSAHSRKLLQAFEEAVRLSQEKIDTEDGLGRDLAEGALKRTTQALIQRIASLEDTAKWAREHWREEKAQMDAADRARASRDRGSGRRPQRS